MEELKKLKNRIDRICEHKVNAFSPTISPAPKSPERNEIESIDKAIRFFYQQGVREIVTQKKYMGSYCDIYLHKDPEKTYFISRNGYKIEHIDMEATRKACSELHKRFDWTDLQVVMIQSELMPWSAMGKHLIENEFGGYLNVHRNHYEQLAHSDLYDKIKKVKDSQSYKEYMADKGTISFKEFRKKYPSHIVRQYESCAAFKVLDLEVYKKSIDIYEKQIDYYGKEGEIYFKPFNILKKIYDDGTEDFINDNLSYRELNEDEFLHLSFNDEEELSVAIDKVYEWFKKLENNMEEGIVIKSRQAFTNGLPPAFKIRNNQYLVMIYGVDFYDQYEYYLRKRSISRKLECSINDWMINRELLKVKYKDIDTENYFFKNLIYDRIMGEKAEAGLDSRL